ncbi:LOW QUALITY PROTEIN: hypothetical protein OSB04_016422 [Centaurea solstitialis]|uniref:Tf2-1-like SH3-like domain-containing protein n=1 Tax=Centaurea solstitialis TaxID=347529 RepID=A0AA38W9S6_9ASTR|nr:LOW QUALITY PROTEIN: hypothetical protein OSB04_016422 [Centaurea solstitialis]
MALIPLLGFCEIPRIKLTRGSSWIFGTSLVRSSQRTTENFRRIRERLQTAQNRQKSYADRRRSNLEYQWVTVEASFGPRYAGSFTVLARVGRVAYRLELPEVLGQTHNTFYLRKCLADETTHIPLDDIQVDESLNYVGGARQKGEEEAIEQRDRNDEGAVATSEKI